MLRRVIVLTIGFLLPALAAYADGIPRSEVAKRCLRARTNTVLRIHETQIFTMDVSNEGKGCYLNESSYQDGSGAFGNKLAFESFSLRTPPSHGTVTYSSDSESYILYRPTAGYVGIDAFEYRLFPGNGLRTVTVTVGP